MRLIVRDAAGNSAQAITPASFVIPPVANFGGDTATFTLNNVAGLDMTTSRAQVKITATDVAGNRGESSAAFSLAPMITMANYTKPTLSISGVGFSSSSGQVRVLINGMEVGAAKVTLGGNTVITVKGNKKKLKLNRGSNSLQIFVDNIPSNSTTFQF